jgi:hypothetical protein
MDKVVKIETKTKHTFRSKSTNKTYDTKEEFLRNHKEEDLAIDTAVTVTIRRFRSITKSNGIQKLMEAPRGGTELQLEYLR